MISKKKLLNCLKNNLELEEKAVPVYQKHLSNHTFFAHFPQREKTQIKKTLDKLLNESKRHQDSYKRLISKIKGSDKNDF